MKHPLIPVLLSLAMLSGCALFESASPRNTPQYPPYPPPPPAPGQQVNKAPIVRPAPVSAPEPGPQPEPEPEPEPVVIEDKPVAVVKQPSPRWTEPERTVTAPARPPAPKRYPGPRPVSKLHLVNKGDTLYSIAFKNGLDFSELAAWNRIPEPYTIWPGQKLLLFPPAYQVKPHRPPVTARAKEPPPKRYNLPQPKWETEQGSGTTESTGKTAISEKPAGAEKPATSPVSQPSGPNLTAPEATGEVTLSQPASQPETKVKPEPDKPESQPETAGTTAQANNPETPTKADKKPLEVAVAAPVKPATPPPVVIQRKKVTNPAPLSKTGWKWPTRGPLLKRYNPNAGSSGIDIGGRVGMPVKAAAGGEVVYGGSGLQGYGLLLILKHDNTYLSAYGFNSQLLVEQGELVEAGQVVAIMGEGPARKPLVHFEIRRKGKPVNPESLLPRR